MSRTFWLILGFAVAHALAATVCRLVGIGDALFLTVLTMGLTVIVCLRNHLTMEMTAISMILVNVVCYVLGIAMARFLGLFISGETLVHALSTFLVTELWGWTFVGFVRLYAPDGSLDEGRGDNEVAWLVAILAVIFLMRGLVEMMAGGGLFAKFSFADALRGFVSNTVVVLMLAFGTMLFVRYCGANRSSLGLGTSVALSLSFIAGTSFFAALFVGYGLPFSIKTTFDMEVLVEYFIIAIICESGIYSFAYMLDYSYGAKVRAEEERINANLAKTQYLALKQQVNPHFLFNSLNILAALVSGGRAKEAEDYIQKLAAIYRYMLGKENVRLSSLEDEMGYVGLYVDLLKVRFGDGLCIEEDVPKEDMGRSVVTFSVQMLVENAVKHNAISQEKPLKVRISSDGRSISVSNGLLPKIVKPDSPGIGLRYISRNYKDAGGRDISIDKTEDEFTVTMPLL